MVDHVRKRYVPRRDGSGSSLTRPPGVPEGAQLLAGNLESFVSSLVTCQLPTPLDTPPPTIRIATSNRGIYDAF